MKKIPHSTESLIKQSFRNALKRNFQEILPMDFGRIFNKPKWSYPKIQLQDAVQSLFEPEKIKQKRSIGKFLPINSFLDVLLSSENEPDFEIMEILIKSLANFRIKFSYEVFGNYQEIRIVFGTNKTFLEALKAAIKGVFPSTGIVQIPDPLPKLLRSSLEIREYFPKKAFHLSLSTYTVHSVTPWKLAFQAIQRSRKVTGIQVIFSPTDQDFHKIIPKLYDTDYLSSIELGMLNLGNQNKNPSLYLPLIAKNVEDKTSGTPFFYTVIRSFGDVKTLATFFNTFLYGGMELGFNSEQNYPIGSLQLALVQRKSYIFPMVLNSKELTNFCFFYPIPPQTEKAPVGLKTNWHLPLPKELSSGATFIGNNNFFEPSQKVFIPENESRSLYCCGNCGTGKSNFLASILLEEVKHNDRGALVVDLDGNFIDLFLSNIGKHKDRVILLDFGLKDFVPEFNILNISHEISKDKAAFEMAASFRSIFRNTDSSEASWGNNIETVLRQAFYVLFSNKNCAFSDIRTILSKGRNNLKKRQDLLSNISDNTEAQRFWQEDFNPSSPLYLPTKFRVSRLFLLKKAEDFFSNTLSRFSIQEIISKEKILAIKVPTGALGEDIACLLGSLFVNLFILETFANPPQKPFYFYLDEIQRYGNAESLSFLVTQGRKRKLFLRCASQATSQLNSQLRDLISNFQTQVFFNCSLKDSQWFSQISKSLIQQDFLHSLGLGKCVVKIGNLISTVQTLPLLEEDPGLITEILQESKNNYYRSLQKTHQMEVNKTSEIRNNFDEI